MPPRMIVSPYAAPKFIAIALAPAPLGLPFASVPSPLLEPVGWLPPRVANCEVAAAPVAELPDEPVAVLDCVEEMVEVFTRFGS